MASSAEPITFTPRQYVELAKTFRIRHRLKRSLGACRHRIFAPVDYGIVEDKGSGETICFLWFNEARTEWVVVEDEEGELAGLFA